ncbi:MAG: Flp pilus assembly protein CpaB [Candidatus Omnitrophota bacterium]
MENKRQIFLIAVAVVAGIGATVLTSKYVTDKITSQTQILSEKYAAQQRQDREQSQQQMAQLQEEINRTRTEQQQAMQQALQQAAAAAKAAQQQAAAQQQQMQMAAKKRAATFLTAKTPAGKRAVTVMIDSLAAVGGLLNAGDFVDVIGHLNVPQETSTATKTITAMVFQDLQVLAINTNLEEPGAYDEQQSSPSLKVTFAVDPQEAGLLAFANKNGKLELALRSSNENDKQTVKASTWKTLADYVLQNQGSSFDVPEDEEVKKEQPEQKPYIQIFRGGKEL